MILIFVKVLAESFQSNWDMIKSRFTDLIDLIINQFQNWLVVSFSVDSFSEHFKTVPNHISDAQISLFTNFRYSLLFDDMLDLSQ